MGTLLKNKEYHHTASGLLVFMAAAMVALCLLIFIQVAWLHAGAVDQIAAATGKIAAAHPELERELVASVISKAGAADVERGRSLLASYGYSADMPITMNPMLGPVLPVTLVVAVLFMLTCAAFVLGITGRGYAGVYRKVRAISEAAEKIVEGDFSSRLPAVGEGEFEVLGHRFNQMANRLKVSVEQLTQDKVFLKNTISDISHQLKTPLSTLIVYNDLMIEENSMDTANRRDFLEMSRQQLQRLEWLIQNLLKMARLEAGSIMFRREPVSLKQVADEACAALRAAADGAGVELAVEEKHMGACYSGDADWLAEAVINVVKNAIEHSLPGSVVTVSIDHTPLTASMTITDRGSGIDADDLPHIFERFYRGTRSVKPNSIGIGLAMSKAIVEGQGGTISVRSETRRGSEFTIVFIKTLGETGSKTGG